MEERADKLFEDPPKRIKERYRVTRSEIYREIMDAGLRALEKEKSEGGDD